MPITVRYDVPAGVAGPIAYQGGYDASMGAQEQAAEQRRWQAALQAMQNETQKNLAAMNARAAGARAATAAGMQSAEAEQRRQWELEDRPYRESLLEDQRAYEESLWNRNQSASDERFAEQQRILDERMGAQQKAMTERELAAIRAKQPGLLDYAGRAINALGEAGGFLMEQGRKGAADRSKAEIEADKLRVKREELELKKQQASQIRGAAPIPTSDWANLILRVERSYAERGEPITYAQAEEIARGIVSRAPGLAPTQQAPAAQRAPEAPYLLQRPEEPAPAREVPLRVAQNIAAQMDAAAKKGDLAELRRLKAQLSGL